MEHLQRALDGSDAILFVDVGSSWAWATSLLEVDDPRRFSLEIAVGSLGRGFAAAIGAAATGRKAIALTGDWSVATLLGEISTAVDADAPATFIVMNSAGGQICLDGDRAIWGRETSRAKFRPADLAAVARALGARSARVTGEDQLGEALREAMECVGPFLVDVVVDTSERPPYASRFETLGRHFGVRRDG
jgi:thiamine pyrophosphate-dependent acetolactate synthase large subunit-like protein